MPCRTGLPSRTFDLAGERDRAREHYRQAARLTLSVPEREYLAGLIAPVRGAGNCAISHDEPAAK
ncbi:hypothetical protein ACFY2W_04995 [Streptomyces sp. NPDC001262]|uniref:hypothetical protein n=1 Tax=unclassified Streptomyces TaxID=2593676 RepID=UPI00368002F8